jgi:ABC-type glycerol-3-phosphate transport system substrate-binding protein
VTSPFDPHYTYQDAWAAAYGTAQFGILESWWSKFRASFYPQVQTIFTGEATPEKAAAAWQAAAEPIIAENTKK